MNEISPKKTLSKYGVYPSKGLGQNFLIDKKIVAKIIQAANIKASDIILEIGPGLGVLTQKLALYAKKVITVEKDPKMAEILNEELKIKNIKNVKIVRGDILKVENCDILKFIENCKLSAQNRSVLGEKIKNYKVVSNIPYYITAPLIKKLLEAKCPPRDLVLMIQKEVAQRICSRPPKMNLLAVSVQFYGEPKIISYVSKNCFWPKPKVDGAILKISTFNQRRKSTFNQRFFKIVKAGFFHPRKQLAGNLAKNLKLTKEQIIAWLLKNNIDPKQRAETLSISDWERLTKTNN